MINTSDVAIGDRFWQSLDQLVAVSEVIVDRPSGPSHPRDPEFVYPLDYGYLRARARSTRAAEISGSAACRAVVGVVITLDLRKKDTEVKILLGCTHEEAQRIQETLNRQSQAGILVMREDSPSGY